MKTVFVCLVVACSVMMVSTGVVLDGGIPIAKCRPGEHSVLYCPQRAEPTCEDQTIHAMAVPGPCDIPQCFCNAPAVRKVETGKCVLPKNC